MAGGAVLLPTSAAVSRTSWAQRETPSMSPSPRACCHLCLGSSSIPRSAFFGWDSKNHRNPASLRALLRSTGLLFPSKNMPKRVVYASLLGVGAPEALVIAVVALLVFGPRGLAEVARTLGKSLRAFQPTIRELQQISRDFKDTLEQEIGLDELRSTTAQPTRPPPPEVDQPAQASSGESAKPQAYTTEEYAKVTEEQAQELVSDEQRKVAEATAWGGNPPGGWTKPEESIQRGDEVTNNAGHSQ